MTGCQSTCPPPDLRALTGYLLRRAFVRAASAARECIPTGEHVREIAIMAILAERGAVSQRELADVTHVNRSLIVKLVDDLEARGWVVRDRNPEDRRSYALRLTPQAHAVLAERHQDLDRGEAQLMEPLTPDERQRFKDHLTVLLTGDEAVTVTMMADRAGYLIAHAHRLLRSWAEAGFAPLDLHPRDFGVLAALGRQEPCSQNQLAASLGVTPPAVLAFVDELEQKGLVARSRNRDDRRAYDVTLTSQGRARLRAAQAVARGIQQRVEARLGAESDSELRGLLIKLLHGDV